MGLYINISNRTGRIVVTLMNNRGDPRLRAYASNVEQDTAFNAPNLHWLGIGGAECVLQRGGLGEDDIGNTRLTIGSSRVLAKDFRREFLTPLSAGVFWECVDSKSGPCRFTPKHHRLPCGWIALYSDKRVIGWWHNHSHEAKVMLRNSLTPPDIDTAVGIVLESHPSW
jgi:hypothetical protein